MVTRNSHSPDATSLFHPWFWLIGFVLLLAAAVAAAQTTYEVVHGFRSTGKPMSSLVQVGNDLYGTTYYGGTSGVGTVFKMDPDGNVTTVHSFGYADGAFPTAGLVYATDGDFYGTTTAGGTSNKGVIFRMDASGHVTPLHSFDGIDGERANAALIQASDGDFYGTTSAGGGIGHIGIVFRMSASGQFTVLHRFSITDGFYPYASLMQASDGNSTVRPPAAEPTVREPSSRSTPREPSSQCTISPAPATAPILTPR